MYCDRQSQQEEGITGMARGRRRRWRTRKKVEDVFRGGSNRTRRGFQLDPTTPNGADTTREEPGKKELEPSVKC